MNPNLLVGLALAILGHILLLLGLRVNLVDPGPGPSADAQFILVSATPAAALSDEALLRDPSVFFLPSRVTLRPALGRYRELIEPSVFFNSFEPDTDTGLTTVAAMRLNYPPAPDVTQLARQGPVFDFSLQRDPLPPNPTAPSPPANALLRNLSRPGKTGQPLNSLILSPPPSPLAPPTLVFQIADPRLPQLPALVHGPANTTSIRLPIPPIIGSSGYFSLSIVSEPTEPAPSE